MRAYERGTERWEIELREQHVVTRHFEHHELVDDATSAHTTPLRAKWEADRFCLRLADDGFVRTAGEHARIGKSEFEDALRADPDDLEMYLVYADWLSEHGDDWGQLIAVQHAQHVLPRFGQSARRDELSRADAALQFQLASHLWGALGETVDNEHTQRYAYERIDATWRCGFLHTARIGNAGASTFGELVRALHELPIASVLRELTVDEYPWKATMIDAIAKRTWKTSTSS